MRTHRGGEWVNPLVIKVSRVKALYKCIDIKIKEIRQISPLSFISLKPVPKALECEQP